MTTPVLFLAHVPLARMKCAEYPIGPGALTKIPWEEYDNLTNGAFTAWRPKYEAADPVFFAFQQEVDLRFAAPGRPEPSSTVEMKIPPRTRAKMLTGLGLSVMEGLHRFTLEPVLAALAITAPSALPAPARDSVCFLLAMGNNHFDYKGVVATGFRLQGNTDQELVYLTDAASTPLTDADLNHASSLVEGLSGALGHDVLGPKLREFLALGHPSLAPSDRMLLAVAELEDLLLPDVHTEVAPTFARRASNLLGRDETQREAIRLLARAVYRSRNAAIHAKATKAEFDLPPAAAEQLLAASLERLARAHTEGADLHLLLGSLDTPSSTISRGWSPSRAPSARAPELRMAPRQPWGSATAASSGRLGGSESLLVGYSPLAGLGPPALADEHAGLGVETIAMTSPQIVSMEEKDIRRDFVASLQLSSDYAALKMVASQPPEVDTTTQQIRPLIRRRDLAVVGLRLAGSAAFIDPELLGWFVYRGQTRYRRETVFRQSVLMRLSGDADPIPPVERVHDAWDLLLRYETTARDGRVDKLLQLYRRGHDRLFLAPATRASVLFLLLEGLLGPFRTQRSPKSLERLVAALDQVPPESREWFERNGRVFRNSVAHSSWGPLPVPMDQVHKTDHTELAHLLVVAGHAVRSLLGVWTAVDPRRRAANEPAALHAKHLAPTTT